MRFIISFLLTAVLSYIACIYFPWWSFAIAAFVVAVIIHQKPGKTFLCGFLSLFLLWAGLSFWLSYNNGHILASKLSLLFYTGNSYLFIILTGIIGGLVGGFAALAGSFVRKKSN